MLSKYIGDKTLSINDQLTCAKKLKNSAYYYENHIGSVMLRSICYQYTNIPAWDDEYYIGVVPTRLETLTSGLGYMNPRQEEHYFWTHQAPIIRKYFKMPIDMLGEIVKQLVSHKNV